MLMTDADGNSRLKCQAVNGQKIKRHTSFDYDRLRMQTQSFFFEISPKAFTYQLNSPKHQCIC